MKLRGQPYYTGKPAFHPRTGKQVLTHYFGGFVCSAQCEVKIFDDMKSYGVWGSGEARMRANAYDRHNAK